MASVEDVPASNGSQDKAQSPPSKEPPTRNNKVNCEPIQSENTLQKHISSEKEAESKRGGEEDDFGPVFAQNYLTTNNLSNIKNEVKRGQDGENNCGWLGKLLKSQLGLSDSTVLIAAGCVLMGILIWIILYGIVEDEVVPGGDLFRITVLVLISFFAGKIVGLVRLPPLLGMLIAGIVLKSVGFFTISGIYPDLVMKLRETALTVILIKAGLGLDAGALLKLSLVVLRLAILPCIGEAVAAAAFSYFILDYPILWGLLLGFMLSAVSPAVVVPTLLSLKDRGYGEDKGIATLVIAASSLDDIVAISVFGVFLGIIFTPGPLLQQLGQGPLEMVVGLVGGILWGLISAIVPHRDDKHVVAKRVCMIGAGGLSAVLGSEMIHLSGAGPLATIVAAFTASLCWKLQGWSSAHNPVADTFGTIWICIQPMLFGLIGAEIDIRVLHVETISKGLLVIGGSLILRVLTCCVVLLGSKLNWKEIVFVNLAWLPKATVQAALGPNALDMVRHEPNSPEIDYLRGEQMLTIAVLSILVTAPIGAIGISLTGPHLLSKANDTTSINLQVAETAMHMSEGTQKQENICDDAGSRV